MMMVATTQLEAQTYLTAGGQVSFDTNISSNSTLIDQIPPKKPLAELNIVNQLASIVHQTDRNGNRQPVLTGARRVSREGSNERKQRGGFRNIFTNIWSAFGLIDQELDLDTSKQGISFTSRGSTIELRSSLLPPLSITHFSKKCLVLDLDETLVHSSFKPTDNYDFIVPVEIDGVAYTVYVCKRPGAERFLTEMAKYYEIVVYTASLSNYADPLLDKLDPEGVISHRLYREHCVQYEGDYVKDLSLLDRDISQTIIVDNSPRAYTFHPQNAIGCSSFIDDLNDRELKSIALFLTKNRDVEDVRDHLHMWNLDY